MFILFVVLYLYQPLGSLGMLGLKTPSAYSLYYTSSCFTNIVVAASFYSPTIQSTECVLNMAALQSLKSTNAWSSCQISFFSGVIVDFKIAFLIPCYLILVYDLVCKLIIIIIIIIIINIL